MSFYFSWVRSSEGGVFGARDDDHGRPPARLRIRFLCGLRESTSKSSGKNEEATMMQFTLW
ncbi:hypothetical protein PIB30_027790 [Stylosanthes scabra]|uniref:Uncharacterized protein n=1 Tax=Stylosanthes scabra TaxID=79078 RepID=A0ABU6RB10_9FABA|nr:hypothetical protein [Stylosanthes scabra]